MPRPASGPREITDGAIAEAALEILRAGGPTALSFRRVGARLGTSHMRIHRRCGSVEGLLDLCAEHLAARLPEAESGLAWADATVVRFTALYDLLVENSALVALQSGRPWLGPVMMRRFAEPALAESVEAGLSLAEMVEVHRLLYMFTVGCALTHDSYDQVGGRAVLADLDPAATPALAAQAPLIDVELTHREVFDGGLAVLVAAHDPGRERRSRT